MFVNPKLQAPNKMLNIALRNCDKGENHGSISISRHFTMPVIPQEIHFT
jgi:hypothetical protein